MGHFFCGIQYKKLNYLNFFAAFAQKKSQSCAEKSYSRRKMREKFIKIKNKIEFFMRLGFGIPMRREPIGPVFRKNRLYGCAKK